MVDTYEDLGDYTKKVTLKNPEAQKWIDRASMQLFGFNHPDSIYCAKKALEIDADIPYAYFLISYASGPHYNFQDMSAEQYAEANLYLKKGLEKKSLGAPWEQDLLEALKTRYSDPMPLDAETRAKHLIAFSKTLKPIYEKYQDDLDICGFYAESVMLLKPWQLWVNGKPIPEGVEAREVLDKAWKKGYHPLLAHLLIHLLELSPCYKEALPVADALLKNSKGVGHLLHMPSHIYIQAGDYQKSMYCNKLAVAVDGGTVSRIGINNFTTFYRAHNVQFLIWAAMFAGDFDLAYKNALFLNAEVVTEEVIAGSPNIIEFFSHTATHVLIRFGKWDEILALPYESRPNYKFNAAFTSYAKVLAYAVKGQAENAEKEMEKFKALTQECPPNRRVGNNTAEKIFEICFNMAEGELLYRKKDFDTAFVKLRKSVELYDKLIYCEPWDYMMPTRHALAALLLENGRLDESAKVYQEDLATNPDNIWSLTGLKECYQKLGKTTEEQEIEKRLDIARQVAKTEIKSSCFCKLS